MLCLDKQIALSDTYTCIGIMNIKNTLPFNTALHVQLFHYISNSSRESTNYEGWLKKVCIIKYKLSKLLYPPIVPNYQFHILALWHTFLFTHYFCFLND